ncbi:MAG TPA: DoxX family protein [Stellaceae bacterium]|nr:DoxX family protein [Stellaceae bacterium]
MTDIDGRLRLYLPFLHGFYDSAAPLAWPIVRLAVGWNLAVHGWGKVMAGPAALAKGFVDLGFHDPKTLIVLLTFVEFVGGICIALGFFTRFFAAAVAIEMAYITFGLYWPTGFSWLRRGYEYTLMWGLISFAISLQGGGAYSLDRIVGREL